MKCIAFTVGGLESRQTGLSISPMEANFVNGKENGSSNGRKLLFRRKWAILMQITDLRDMCGNDTSAAVN